MQTKFKNKAREQLAEMYINSLKDQKLPWIRDWAKLDNYNPTTRTVYKGVNRLILELVSSIKEYDDPRWMTFKQIKQKGYHLQKGAKGTPIEYWAVYDIINKKTVSLQEYQKLLKSNERTPEEFRWLSNVYCVFNAKYIDGIPKLEVLTKEEKHANEFVDNLIKGLGVKYEEAGTSAYYSPKEDKVVIPPSKLFDTEEGYYATQLHELCHSTGHSSRLNRNISNKFGSEDYAKEELRAEISSSFLMGDLHLEYDKSHLENHKAYIQSWIQEIEEKPDELFKAISDAEKISDYAHETVEKYMGKEEYDKLISNLSNEVEVYEELDENENLVSEQAQLEQSEEREDI